MNLDKTREDFPLFRQDNPPAYLDNACVTLKPDSVIETIHDYYTMNPGCAGRSVHRFGTKVSLGATKARKTLANYINSNQVNEVVWTRNATHSLNQIAKGLEWNKGDVILTTDREHNSNLVPWIQLEEEQGVDHRVIASNEDNSFSLENFERECENAGTNLKMVSVSHVGNLDGVKTPLKEVAKIAHDYGALVCADAAQSTPHMKVDVQDLDVDFMVMSIHKMLGPTGMGAMWAKQEHLETMRSIQSGGQTVKTSNYDSVEWETSPSKFEGGLGHFAGMLGAEPAIAYLANLNMDDVHEKEIKLNRIMSDGIKDLPGVEIIGPEDARQRSGICSVLLDDLPVHDIALLLDEAAGVMCRSGNHCVHSWFNDRGHKNGSLRASAYFYNTEDEAKLFAETLSEAVNAFS